MVNQIICKACGTVKDRIQPFHHIPLDVKVNNNIFDAFTQFVSGETIADYRCDACDKLVEIDIRVGLVDLPQILIVHLKRIVFDFDKFETNKINTRFEFPQVCAALCVAQVPRHWRDGCVYFSLCVDLVPPPRLLQLLNVRDYTKDVLDHKRTAAAAAVAQDGAEESKAVSEDEEAKTAEGGGTLM